jgi:hypothetical protein
MKKRRQGKQKRQRRDGRKRPAERRGARDRKPYRRFKVEQLPPKAQAVVFEGLARGESYPAIARAVTRLGNSISRDAIMRFRQCAWNAERNRLKRARANLALLKDILGLDARSPSAQIAEEMLYTSGCNNLSERESAHLLGVLREAREQRKARGRKGAAGDAGAPERNPVEQAREIRRRWRKLYGLEEAEDAEE